MSVLKNACRSIVLFLLIAAPASAYSSTYPQFLPPGGKTERGHGLLAKSKIPKKLKYYLFISDFIQSFIQIPTSNVAVDSSTISSKYLAGRASVYNAKNDHKVGVCSASFLCMQNANGIFTDIANYLSISNNGLIITWFTPTTLINLELDNIVNSMVTECIVTASTKVGKNLYYGKKFNMVVSSNGTKIFFKLKRI